MRRSSRLSWPGLLLLAALTLPIAAGSLFAQTPAGATSSHSLGLSEPHDTADLYNSLRDVINYGAELFNKQADHVGCYRVYQGSLISIRPFMAPEVRKKIDESIVRAEALPFPADRAFELRRILDEIRAKATPNRAAPSTVAGSPAGNSGTKAQTPAVSLPKDPPKTGTTSIDLPRITDSQKIETPAVGFPNTEKPKLNPFPPIEKKVDLPTIDLPKVDPPKVDLPKIDPPKVDLPKIDPPKVDLPKVDPPKVDLPKVDPPKVDLPKIDPPKVDLPKVVDLPKIDPPKVDLPKVDPPKVDLPKIDPPKVDLPKVDPPKVDLPKIDPPKVDLPKVDLPKVDLPPINPFKVEPPAIEPKDKKNDSTRIDLPTIVPPPDSLDIQLPQIGTQPVSVTQIEAIDKKDEEPRKQKGEVSGTVVVDGKPLPPGFFVTLVSEEGKRFSTTVQKEGSYRFTLGIAVGKYRVFIEPPVNDAGKQTVVPGRYLDEATSGLTLQVVAGKSTLDVRLMK